jgi:hypothetical protein
MHGPREISGQVVHGYYWCRHLFIRAVFFSGGFGAGSPRERTVWPELFVPKSARPEKTKMSAAEVLASVLGAVLVVTIVLCVVHLTREDAPAKATAPDMGAAHHSRSSQEMVEVLKTVADSHEPDQELGECVYVHMVAEPHVEGVIRNVKRLFPSWTHTAVCSSVDFALVQGFEIPGLNVVATDQTRNALLLTPGFWRGRSRDRVLLYDGHSTFFHNDLRFCEQYDYVGALRRGAGESGLSLRSAKCMLRCLDARTPPPGVANDAFFVDCMRAHGTGTVAPCSTAKLFAQETIGDRALCGHRYWQSASNTRKPWFAHHRVGIQMSDLELAEDLVEFFVRAGCHVDVCVGTEDERRRVVALGARPVSELPRETYDLFVGSGPSNRRARAMWLHWATAEKVWPGYNLVLVESQREAAEVERTSDVTAHMLLPVLKPAAARMAGERVSVALVGERPSNTHRGRRCVCIDDGCDFDTLGALVKAFRLTRLHLDVVSLSDVNEPRLQLACMKTPNVRLWSGLDLRARGALLAGAAYVVGEPRGFDFANAVGLGCTPLVRGGEGDTGYSDDTLGALLARIENGETLHSSDTHADLMARYSRPAHDASLFDAVLNL